MDTPLQNFFAVLKGGGIRRISLFLFEGGVSEKSLCVLCVRAQKTSFEGGGIHRNFSAFGGLKGGVFVGGGVFVVNPHDICSVRNP